MFGIIFTSEFSGVFISEILFAITSELPLLSKKMDLNDLNIEDIEELIKCSICLDIYSAPRALPCQHSFCSECLVPLLNKRLLLKPEDYQRKIIQTIQCPECREVHVLSASGIEELPDNYTLLSLIEFWSKTSKKKNSEMGTRPNEKAPHLSHTRISYRHLIIKNKIEKYFYSIKTSLKQILVIIRKIMEMIKVHCFILPIFLGAIAILYGIYHLVATIILYLTVYLQCTATELLCYILATPIALMVLFAQFNILLCCLPVLLILSPLLLLLYITCY